MGFNFGKIVSGIANTARNIGKGTLWVADKGAEFDIPILEQIDGVADVVREIQVKRKIDKETIDYVLESLEDLKETIPTSVPEAKGLLQSNRFKATILGTITAILAHFGLSAELAQPITEIVFYSTSTYLLADTIRPSVKPVSK